MHTPKIIVAAQYYAPDDSSTAAYTTEIARALTSLCPVEVLSGTPTDQSMRAAPGQPLVRLVRNRIAAKGALTKRLAQESMFALRTFFHVLARARRGDVVLVVTSPFVLPYAVVAAAFLKGARSVLLLYDLYPDVLVVTGIVGANHPISRVLHVANGFMYRALDAVITIGRDTERLLLRYAGASKEKLHFIPNWATLPIGQRSLTANRFRKANDAFVVGLSGNLGFTHDPHVVFEAAKRLMDQPGIRFLLSGWGTGFDSLKDMQTASNLPNVTIGERVPEEHLDEFLASADAWLIPYRPNVAGVSIPSRFYNLLAVGRPIILISEPDSEAAMTIAEHDLGWVVPPGDAEALAQKIVEAVSSGQSAAKGANAARAAQEFGREAALQKYRAVFAPLLGK